MATTPAFAATPKAWGVTVPATFDTSMTAPSNTVDLVTGGTSGSKVEEIRMSLVATVAATTYNLFLHDGTTHHLFHSLTQTAFTVSTSLNQPPVVLNFANLIVPNGWKLRITTTTAGGQSTAKFTAFGGDF